MHLDSLTLMVPDAFASAVAALFLLCAWLNLKTAPALPWWAAANGIGAVGLAVLTAGLAWHAPALIMPGAGLAGIVPALIWGGVRRFNNQSAPPVLLAAGVFAWLATALAPFAIDHQKWATLVSFAIWYVYVPAAIWGLWSSRAEKLYARWPLMVLLALHGLMFVGAGHDLLFGSFALNKPPGFNGWFSAIHFEAILYAMGSAIFMVLMCKERIELRYIEAANVDALTGIANHGAWFDSARRLLDRCRQDGTPFSLIMFDLDHFKEINDRHGHQVGDRVLRSFADTVRGALRPNDLFGRYGGEEFSVVVPGARVETAFAVAERVRRAFADSHRFLDGARLDATVSAGVASASPGAKLEAVIDAADKAMYGAKMAGRNRTRHIRHDHPNDDGGNVVRVA